MPFDSTIIDEITGRYEENLTDFALTHGVPTNSFAPLALQKHPIQLVASRMYCILNTEFHTFAKTVKDVISTMEFSPKGLKTRVDASDFVLTHTMCWDKDKEAIIVFPNLPSGPMGRLGNFTWNTARGATKPSEYRNVESAYFPKYSMQVQDEIACDLSDPIKHNKWLPIQRGINRLKKRQATTVGRALTNYLRTEHGSLQVHDQAWLETVASRVIASTRPPVLHWIEGREGFRKMYSWNNGGPQSCMDSRKAHDRLYVDGYSKQGSKIESFIKNVQPVDWYGDNPIAFGAYLERAGIVLARVVYYKHPITGVRMATRAYGVTTEMQKSLVKLIKEEGIDTQMCMNASSTKTVFATESLEFTMPTNTMAGADVTPFPYFDWFPYAKVFVRQSHDVTTFVCTPKHLDKMVGFTAVSLHNVQGYVSLSAMQEQDDEEYVYCESCGDEHHTQDVIYMDNGVPYCCESCARDHSWIMYQTGTDRAWRPIADVGSIAVPGYDGIAYFSNQLNARHSGILVTYYPWALPELDTPITYHHQFAHTQYMGSRNTSYRVMYRMATNVSLDVSRIIVVDKAHVVVPIATPNSPTRGSLYSHQGYSKMLVESKEFRTHGLFMKTERITTIGELTQLPIVAGIEKIENQCLGFFAPLHEYEQELDTLFEDLPIEGASVKAFDNLRDTILTKGDVNV